MKTNVLCYLEQTVKKFPNKTAIVDEHSSVDFKTLQKHSKSIATKLQEFKIPRLSLIGVLLPKSIQSLKSFFGIVYNGCVYVPIDIKNPPTRIKAICDNLDIKFIITNEVGADLIKDTRADTQVILFDDIDLDACVNFSSSNYEKLIDTDPLYVFNTSGSTGTPKGVVIPHRAIIDYTQWITDEYELDDSLMIGNQAPLCFDMSSSDIYVMLKTGATLFLIPEKLFAFPPKLLEYIKQQNINYIHWVPSILVALSKLDSLKDTNIKLKIVLATGEAMPAKHLIYWMKHIPSAVYANLYGPTETAVVSTHFKVNRTLNIDEPVPIGHPCKNTDVIVLDEYDNLITDENITGELCIRGTSLAFGYYNDPEKTEQAFVQNPLNKAYPEKIYRTGDIVYYNQNKELVYKCRKDFQIKHQGYRIELGEIETAILAIKDIDNACVLYDQESKNIILFYESLQKLSKKDILLLLQDKLPKYMIPTKFIQLDEMPLNVNGKIDRNKLKSLF